MNSCPTAQDGWHVNWDVIMLAPYATRADNYSGHQSLKALIGALLVGNKTIVTRHPCVGIDTGQPITNLIIW